MAGFGAVGATFNAVGLRAFTTALASAQSGFNNVAASATAFEAGLRPAINAAQTMNTAVEALRDTTRIAADAFDTLTAPIQAAASGIQSAAQNILRAAQVVGSEVIDAFAGITAAAAALGVGGVAGLTAFTAALGAAVGAAIGIAARFQQEIIDLAAITQAVPQTVNEVTQSVRDMARSFATAIPDIQRTSLELVKAGVAPDDVTSGVLELTLALQQLSKGELTASSAGEAIASMLVLFKRRFEEVGNTTGQATERIVNSITGIANATRASIPEVVNALTIVGPAFANAGQTIEQATASLGLLLAAGLRGEVAGTALRNFFLRLQAPAGEAASIMDRFGISMVDAQGRTLPYSTVLAQLVEKFGEAERKITGITDEEANWALGTLFQTRALTAQQLAIAATTQGYDDMLEEIRQTNVLQQAGQMTEALTRQLGILRNQLELAAIAFGTEFLQGVSAGVKSFNDFLREGERVDKMLAALGKSAASLSFGTNEDRTNARFDVGAQFGPQAAETFSNVEEQIDRFAASFSKVIEAAGRFRDTLADIALPEGIDAPIQRIGGFIEDVNLRIAGFIDFLSRIAPAAANAFTTAVTGAFNLGRELADVITRGDGVQGVSQVVFSFGDIAAEAGRQVRGIALAVAGFVRALLDNQTTIVNFATLVIQVFSGITQGIINTATAIVNLIGFFDRLGNNKVFQSVALGGLSGGIPGAVTGGITAAFSPDTPAPFVFGEAAEAQRELQSYIEALRSGESSSEAFASATQGAMDTVSRWADQLTGGRRAAEEQIDALRELQRVMAEGSRTGGGDLATFLGDPKIPEDIRQSVFNMVQALNSIDPSDVAGEAEAMAALHREVEFVNAAIGVQIDLLTKKPSTVTPPGTAVTGGSDAEGAARRDFDREAREAKARADALKQTQDQLTEAAEDAERNVSAAFRTLENSVASVEQRYRDSMESIAESVEDATTRIRENSARQQKDLQDNFDLRKSREDASEILRRSQEDQARIFGEGLEDRKRERAQGIEDLDRFYQRVDQRTETGERDRLDTINRFRQREVEDSQRNFARAQEDAVRAITLRQQAEQDALTKSFDTVNQSRQQDREDRRRREQLARDLTKATTAEDRRSIQERFNEESRALKERRSDQNEDRQITLQQERQQKELRKQQEQELISFRRSQEDTVLIQRRQQEEADLSFRKAQEIDFQAFRERMENLAIQRRRLAAAQELILSRRDAGEQVGFTRGQQDETRDVARDQALEDLQRAQEKVEEARQRELRELAAGTARRISAQNRTTSRELLNAGRTFEEQMQRIRSRAEDVGTNLLRRAPDIAPALASAQAVISAQTTVAEARAQGFVDNTVTRLGGLRDASEGTLDGFLADLQRAQELTNSLVGGPVNVAIQPNPQLDRLVSALDRLSGLVEHIQPGVNVEELNIETVPERVGEVVNDLFDRVGGR